MTIQSNPIQQLQSIQTRQKNPSIETLVGNQKQEYPKPSIPPEDNLDKPVTSPIKDEYSTFKNEATATLEVAKKNAEQTKKEEAQTHTPSLTDGQTLALKAKSTQDKINVYKAGSDVETEVNVSVQNNKTAIEEYRNLQELQQKQNGLKTYQSLMGGLLFNSY